MRLCVALSAQCDQVLLLVATRLAAKFAVAHLQVLQAAASLASPAVALQHAKSDSQGPAQTQRVARAELGSSVRCCSGDWRVFGCRKGLRSPTCVMIHR
jgi:hypothetical protein